MSAYRYFDKIFRIRSLIEIYNKNIRETSAVGLDKINSDKFKEEYKDHISIINKKVMNGTYNFTPYKMKLISKGEEKVPRVISVPTFRDRITLRALCDILSNIYNSDLNRSLPQVKVETINKNIKNKKYDSFIKIDIINFYPSVNHQLLLGILKKRIRKKLLLDLIEKAIKNNTVIKSRNEKLEASQRGIPQGLSISNILAEIYISEIDKKYQENGKISYVRYVDDILIFCKKSDVGKIYSELKQDIESISLSIHSLNEKNSKSQSGDIEEEIHFLGYRYLNRLAGIIPINRQKFEDSVASLLTTFKYKFGKSRTKKEQNRCIKVMEWRLNLKITGCIFNNNKRGWMFYFSQIEDMESIYSIDHNIKKMVSRFYPGNFKLKKLSKTFHETKRRSSSGHKYIIDFDDLTANQKRNILETYLGVESLSSKNDDEINRYFSMRISHIIREMEKDVSNES